MYAGGVFDHVGFYMKFSTCSQVRRFAFGNMEEMSMGDSPSCLIHFEGKSGELCKLTTYTLVKIKEYCKKWVKLDGEQKEIAIKLVNVVREWPDIEPEVMPIGTGEIYYHKECYTRFCDKSKVARAEARISKTKGESYKTEKKTKSDQAVEQGEHFIQPMRSSTRIASMISGAATAERRTIHVMPELCIICKRKDAYIMDKVFNRFMLYMI